MPASVYKKKGLSKEEYVNLLKDLYIVKGKSQDQIANILGTHRTTIENHCKKYKIKGRTRIEVAKMKVKRANLTNRQKEILDGILISDGCLDASNSTISSRLTLGFKYKETLEDIIEELSCFNFSPIWQCPNTKCYHTKSKSYKEVLGIRNRWYNDNIKIVPKDIELTPLVCLYWFMGDGYGADYGFYLSTDSFTRVDNEMLVAKLSTLGILSHVTTNNRIKIKGESAEAFKNWIESEKKILKHYEYKFNYRRSK